MYNSGKIAIGYVECVVCDRLLRGVRGPCFDPRVSIPSGGLDLAPPQRDTSQWHWLYVRFTFALAITWSQI